MGQSCLQTLSCWATSLFSLQAPRPETMAFSLGKLNLRIFRLEDTAQFGVKDAGTLAEIRELSENLSIDESSLSIFSLPHLKISVASFIITR